MDSSSVTKVILTLLQPADTGIVSEDGSSQLWNADPFNILQTELV